MAFAPLILAGCLQLSAASSEFLGIVSASGPFRLDGSITSGGATLLSGSVLDTTDSPVRIRLTNKVGLYIPPGSRVRFIAGHAQLERGSLSVASAVPFDVDASSLRVHLGGTRSAGTVTLVGGSIQVAMSDGAATVNSSRGIVVGHVLPRAALSFTPLMQNAAYSASVTGRLSSDRNSPQLDDETSHVKFNLQGDGLNVYAGQRVRIAGMVLDGPTAGLSTTIAVTRIALASPSAQIPDTGGAAIAESLNIIIEEGDGAVNNVKQRVAREVIVKVEDKNHKPVSQATVALLLPRSGASGAFLDGAQLFTALTDDTGHLTVSFIPNDIPGPMTITVEATSGLRKGTKTFTQQNRLLAAAGAAAAAAAAGAAGGAAAGSAAAGSAAGAAAATGAGAGIFSASGAVIAGVAVAAIAGPVAAAVAATETSGATLSPAP